MVLLRMLYCTEYEHIPFFFSFFFFSINFLNFVALLSRAFYQSDSKSAQILLTNIIMASYILLFFTAFKLQHTIESMGEKKQN